MGWERIYPLLLLLLLLRAPLFPPSFLKLYMYYVLYTCLNESFIIKKNKDKDNKKEEEEEAETYINYEEVRLREGTGRGESRTIELDYLRDIARQSFSLYLYPSSPSSLTLLLPLPYLTNY